MASLSCNHRSSRAAYLDVILLSRRLKGLAGVLGPSPFPCDVYSRATREAVQGSFVSNLQCHSGGLENKGFCCIVRTGNEMRVGLSMPMLVVSIVPAATSSLTREVQKSRSAAVLHWSRRSLLRQEPGCVLSVERSCVEGFFSRSACLVLWFRTASRRPNKGGRQRDVSASGWNWHSIFTSACDERCMLLVE